MLWCEHSSSPKALISVDFLFSDMWLGNAICFKMIEHFSELQEKQRTYMVTMGQHMSVNRFRKVYGSEACKRIVWMSCEVRFISSEVG